LAGLRAVPCFRCPARVDPERAPAVGAGQLDTDRLEGHGLVSSSETMTCRAGGDHHSPPGVFVPRSLPNGGARWP
jgi:hypothetical protein